MRCCPEFYPKRGCWQILEAACPDSMMLLKSTHKKINILWDIHVFSLPFSYLWTHIHYFIIYVAWRKIYSSVIWAGYISAKIWVASESNILLIKCFSFVISIKLQMGNLRKRGMRKMETKMIFDSCHLNRVTMTLLKNCNE